jgi:hypothetical protein
MSLDKSGYLCDVDDNKYFYAVNGKVLKNLSDLYFLVKECDDSVFAHHVNSQKNDFSQWILGAFHDDELSDEISNIMDRRQLKDILEAKLHNASDFLSVEQDLLKKIKELLTIVEIKEREYDKKKTSSTANQYDLEHYSRLKTIRGVLDEISLNLSKVNSLSDKERSKRYILISEDISKVAKMLYLLKPQNDGNTKYEKQNNNDSNAQGMLAQIINSLEKILKTQNEVFEKRQKTTEDALSELKNDFTEWKIGDVADHQEIKATFLAFEKNLDYKFDDINEFANKIKDLYYYEEKIKRHTTLITQIDKELFELKKEAKKNSLAIEKTYEILKEISDQLSVVSSADKKSKKN